jgi:glutaredoxin
MILTLYSKPGCHLCDNIRTLLEDLQPEFGFSVDEIDITSDPALYAAYRHEIPVVAREGRELGRGPMNEETLREAISR